MKDNILLQSEPDPYAFWVEKTDPATGLAVPGYGANTIFHFPQPILLQRVELDAFRVGQDVLRPKRVTLTALTGQNMVSKELFAGSPDWHDGRGVIEFTEAVYAWAVSIRCDSKDPARFHTMGMWDPAEWNVPFRFFASTRFYGEYTAMPELDIPVAPPLCPGVIAPQSSSTVKVWADGMFIHFESRYLKTSFSLKRPFIAHLSWDALGERQLNNNFIANYLPYHSSGPWTRDLVDATPPFHWGGRVDVIDNQVTYRDLTCRNGLTLDAQFEVREKEMVVRLTQRCEKPMTLLEAAAWRFVWDVHAAGSVSTLAIPRRGAHRNGYTEPRGSWHVSNAGSLAFEVAAGADPVLLHTEQTGFKGKAPTWNYAGFGRRYIFSQLQLGSQPEPSGMVTLLQGEYKAEMRLTVANVALKAKRPADVHHGIHRALGSGFFFRPEQSGLANNSCSVLAANVLFGSADLAIYTANNPPITPAVDLLRYTLDLVLKKGGPHYGSQFEFHHDAAPSLVISAGRIHQVAPDRQWLADIWPYLNVAISHILDNLDDSGMYTCKHHSGNSGSSLGGGSNAWDDVGFGHHDGYSAALAYRALYCAGALAAAAGEGGISQRCLQAAPALKAAYIRSLFNPDTGWLAGWRSRDGKLHDYGFLFVNGMAINYGILEGGTAKDVLRRLEAKRMEIGHSDFRYGLMTQLIPVATGDLRSSSYNLLPYRRGWRNGLRPDGLDTFGVFCNGCLTPCFSGFYLCALSTYGFTETADQICGQLLESFERGLFDGDRTGAEFFTHEGIPCGYEGSLIHNYYVLAEIAKHKGWVQPTTPEYWPAI